MDLQSFQEVVQYSKTIEGKYFPIKPRILPTVRALAIAWIIQMSDVLELHNRTVFLAIGYLDRYLRLKEVRSKKVPIVAAVSLLIAR